MADDTAFRFADILDFQTHNLTTDLVSVPDGLGLAAIDHGWQRQEDAQSQDSWIAVTGRVGRFVIFSADGDLEELELELSLGNTKKKHRLPVHVILNDIRLDRLHPVSEWSSYSVSVPRETVRRGMNVLVLAPRYGDRHDADAGGPQLRLSRLRLRSRGGRPAWPGRPETIRVGDGIEMPVASFIDLVVRIPKNGRLMGRYGFDSTEAGAEAAFSYIELLDESQTRTTLFHKRFYRRTRWSRDLDVDLSAWSGRVVRIRVGTTGERNGVVHWDDLRISGLDRAALRPPLPPIERAVPDSSGRLGRPDVVVILLDAARADAFSPWGGPHSTPAMERLAAAGTLFAQAISPTPWTGQSIPSILTGLFPDSLGVGAWGSRLPAEVPTLAELMAKAGYRTVLWSQHPFYQNHSSFRRGFEEFHRSPKGSYQTLPTADHLYAEDRPTFAFVHLIPPHAPYEPPAPYRGAYSSWYTGDMSVDAKHLNSYPRRNDAESLTEEDLRYARDRYLENAAFADDLVGRILASLEGSGRYDNALIAVISDHGEGFLEHGRFLHTNSVHREFLHVPFVIKWPASIEAPPAVVAEPVSLVDLVPTLADGLALGAAGTGFQGSSLLPEALDDRPGGLPIYAITRGGHDPDKAPRTRLMLDAEGWRILLGPEDDHLRLYRSATDAAETQNLASDEPLMALLMRQAVLSQWHRNRNLLGSVEPAEQADDLDPELLEQLEALGYLN